MSDGEAVGKRYVVSYHRTLAAAQPTEAQGRSSPHPRPRLSHRHHLCPHDGDSLGVPAAGAGLREWHDLLATPAGVAAGGSVGASPSGAARPAWPVRADRLGARRHRCQQRAGQKRGAKTGRNPVDRGKPGTKHHLLTDPKGLPLVVASTGANRQESSVFEAMIDAISPIKQARGGRRRRPGSCMATKPLTIRAAGRSCSTTGSSAESPVSRSTPKDGWAAIAGSLNAPSPGGIGIVPPQVRYEWRADTFMTPPHACLCPHPRARPGAVLIDALNDQRSHSRWTFDRETSPTAQRACVFRLSITSMLRSAVGKCPSTSERIFSAKSYWCAGRSRAPGAGPGKGHPTERSWPSRGVCTRYRPGGLTGCKREPPPLLGVQFLAPLTEADQRLAGIDGGGPPSKPMTLAAYCRSTRATSRRRLASPIRGLCGVSVTIVVPGAVQWRD